jgi:hypothetical protein
MSGAIGEIEFEIKPASGNRFRATLYTYHPSRKWNAQVRMCVSEREAMRWINARLALRGFAEAYDLSGEGAQ